MTTETVSAGQVRIPVEARDAVRRRQAVTVVSRDRATFVLLHPDDYELVSPLLEQRRRGLPIPIEQLLTEEDLEIISMDDDGDAMGEGILESWDD